MSAGGAGAGDAPPAAKRAKAGDPAKPHPALQDAVARLLKREDLPAQVTTEASQAMARGEAPQTQVAAMLVLLKAKGETASEVAALVKVMRSHMRSVDVTDAEGKSDGGGASPLLDIVATGGDRHHTVTFSTAAAVLAAACGVRVAKHGNRSVSSRSGSADVLEALGVRMLDPEHIAPCIRACGIAFMFAPKFHPAMRHVMPVRRSLGVRTVFNILGPLLNPAGAKRMMLGVYSPDLLDMYGEAVKELGAEHALIVHCCGLDELAPLGVADAVEVRNGSVSRIKIDCVGAMGLAKCTIDDLRGGSCDDNAGILRKIFTCSGGNVPTGLQAVFDTVALNAGAGLYVSGKADTIRAGLDAARRVLLGGTALAKLDEWARTSQSF